MTQIAQMVRMVLMGTVVLAAGCGGERAGWPDPVARSNGLAVYEALAPASPAPDVGSAYFALVNAGTAPDTLVSVTTPVGTAMLHTVVERDGRSSMEHAGPVALAPGDTLRLRPGGYHVMFSSLERRLVVGDTITLTLGFASGVELTVRMPVLTYTDVVERIERLTPP